MSGYPQLATTLQQEADRQQGQADERRLGALYATNPLQARNEAIGMGRFDLADHFGKLDEQGVRSRRKGSLSFQRGHGLPPPVA